jgi:hypothetical protein
MLVFLIFNSEVPLRVRGYCRRSNWASESFDGSSERGLTYSDGHCDGFRRGCGGFSSGRVDVQVLRESSEQRRQGQSARTILLPPSIAAKFPQH